MKKSIKRKLEKYQKTIEDFCSYHTGRNITDYILELPDFLMRELSKIGRKQYSRNCVIDGYVTLINDVPILVLNRKLEEIPFTRGVLEDLIEEVTHFIDIVHEKETKGKVNFRKQDLISREAFADVMKLIVSKAIYPTLNFNLRDISNGKIGILKEYQEADSLAKDFLKYYCTLSSTQSSGAVLRKLLELHGKERINYMKKKAKKYKF